MEEQRQRQEDEARGAGTQAAAETPASAGAPAPSNEDAMLERALAMSMDQAAPAAASAAAPTASSAPTPALASFPDFSAMTEEEQIAYAMQMSMQEARKPLSPLFFLIPLVRCYRVCTFHFQSHFFAIVR